MERSASLIRGSSRNSHHFGGCKYANFAGTPLPYPHVDFVEKHFYHNFPRVRRGESRTHVIRVGLETLKSIQEIGLVLAPETVVWRQSLENGQDRTITVGQRRICFTELSRNQVQQHAERFGPFSLEFRIDTLRQLGALPVIYVPQRLTTDRRLSTVGETIVAEVGDIKHTIEQLHALSQAANQPNVTPDCICHLTNTDPANDVAASYDIPLKSIKDFLNYLGYRNAPFQLMAGVLSDVQNLFYPTDDELHDEVLRYYRQREWRLLAGLVVNNNRQARSLTDVEKGTLLEVNGRFWSKKISDGKGSMRRVDRACAIDKFEGEGTLWKWFRR